MGAMADLGQGERYQDRSSWRDDRCCRQGEGGSGVEESHFVSAFEVDQASADDSGSVGVGLQQSVNGDTQ